MEMADVAIEINELTDQLRAAVFLVHTLCDTFPPDNNRLYLDSEARKDNASIHNGLRSIICRTLMQVKADLETISDAAAETSIENCA